jgi:hypothetical protein
MLVECKTFRVSGHSEADKGDYVPDELRRAWLEKDPIVRFENYLQQEGVLTPALQEDISYQVKAIVDDAVRYAEASPAPDAATVDQYVYAPDGLLAIVGEPGALDPRYVNARDSRTGQPFTIVSPTSNVYEAEEATGRR